MTSVRNLPQQLIHMDTQSGPQFDWPVDLELNDSRASWRANQTRSWLQEDRRATSSIRPIHAAVAPITKCVLRAQAARILTTHSLAFELTPCALYIQNADTVGSRDFAVIPLIISKRQCPPYAAGRFAHL